jgi:hypothetical protein
LQPPAGAGNVVTVFVPGLAEIPASWSSYISLFLILLLLQKDEFDPLFPGPPSAGLAAPPAPTVIG